MSLLQKFKTNSCCVGGRHYSGTTTGIYESISSKGNKMLNSFCTKCKRSKYMTVSDVTLDAEGFKDVFKSVATVVKLQLTLVKKSANNSVRAIETASRIGSAAATRNAEAALAAKLELIKIATIGKSVKVVQKGRGLYWGKKKRCFNSF